MFMDPPGLIVVDATMIMPARTPPHFPVPAVRTLKKLHRHYDVPWCLATGLSPGVLMSKRRLSLNNVVTHTPWVCTHGAVTIINDPNRQCRDATRKAAAPLPARVVDEVMQRLPDSSFAVDRHETQFAGPGYPPLPKGLRRRHVDTDALRAQGADMIRVAHAPAWLTRHGLPDLPVRVHSRHDEPGYAEIVSAKASKVRAVAAVAEDIGVRPDEVWAFGHHDFDIELLEWAGVGLTFADSSLGAWRAADDVYARLSVADHGLDTALTMIMGALSQDEARRRDDHDRYRDLMREWD